jgi:hypothetical protein
MTRTGRAPKAPHHRQASSLTRTICCLSYSHSVQIFQERETASSATWPRRSPLVRGQSCHAPSGNACLTALEVHGRRPLPSGLVAASDPLGPLVQGEHAAWLQPLPDSLLDAGDPAGAVIDRSSLRLGLYVADTSVM